MARDQATIECPQGEWTQLTFAALVPVWALLVIFGVLGVACVFAAYALSDLEGWLYRVRTGKARRMPLF